MSGFPVTNAENASSQLLLNGDLQEKESIEHILGFQFVKLGTSSFRVELGSGLGFSFSGDVADACFYVEMERDMILTADWKQKWGIQVYGRYRDDISMILFYLLL